MDKEARAKLLRERQGALRGPSFDLRLTPEKPKDEIEPKSFQSGAYFTFEQNVKELSQEWVYLPIANKASTSLPTRRVARKSALEAIDEQLQAKLPRVLLPPK
jgi:hypothetical protein